jgi:flagellar motor switch protein FliN/FliY
MPSEDTPAAIASWVAETWASRFSESIETMTGERPRVDCRPAAGAPLEAALWWEQPLSLRPEAIVWVGTPEASWLAIGRNALAAAGLESTEQAEARNTFLEILSQALSGLSQALSQRVGKSISCDNGAETARPAADAVLFEIEVVLGASEPLPLRISVSQGLVEALASGDAAALEVHKSGAPAQDARSQGQGEKTLDLLWEVELPVSVSFGRADLALKDVLKLTTGSIVELNRGLAEPVEVIVNNCVIARGEVVVIDGNYGVRIQEIISRDKRLRTLR